MLRFSNELHRRYFRLNRRLRFRLKYQDFLILLLNTVPETVSDCPGVAEDDHDAAERPEDVLHEVAEPELEVGDCSLT